MKKRNLKLFGTLFLLLFQFVDAQQTIPTLFFGQNAWMPDSVGGKKKSGKLETNWIKVKDSNAKIVRYGGNAVKTVYNVGLKA